uniref:Uncharacterized protein n=1 Tax=Rhizoctonia cerealis bunyavirus TaxID=3068840 RepID=A0AA51BSF8_9VIRU|nr:MAG: hypothetical protein [Rhizoctonia cerealis bunyavirus]
MLPFLKAFPTIVGGGKISTIYFNVLHLYSMSTQQSSIKSSSDIKSKFASKEAAKLFAVYEATGTPRSPETIVKEAQAKLIEEIFRAKLYLGKDITKATLPKDAEIEEVPITTEATRKFLDDNIVNGLVTFAMKEGNMKDDRFYFLIAVGAKGPYYSALPGMSGSNSKSKLQTALADLICQEIASGRDTALSSFFKSRAWTPPMDTLKFMFSKGMHASSFPQEKEKVDLFRADIELIFKGMQSQPKKTKDWTWVAKSEIKFFKPDATKPQVDDKGKKPEGQSDPASTDAF